MAEGAALASALRRLSERTETINPIAISWWLVVWPSLAMGTTLMALNFLGDGLRDALDPKLRGKS